MLLSHEKKFLFVHIQKTGGTSVTKWMQSHIPDMEEYMKPHSPLSLNADRYKDYYKVAFVRNPFDRMVSWYSMIKNQKAHNYLQQQVLTHSSNFTEFILNCEHISSKSNWKPFHYNQIDYLTNAQDKIGVDFVGRFENFSQGIEIISEYLAIPSNEIGHMNQSDHTSYHDYYTKETREIITKRFKRDLEYFKYTF